MTKNRKNTNKVKSRYEKERKKQRQSAGMIVAHARRTDDEKERTKQKKSASMTAHHAKKRNRKKNKRQSE
jgi:hypothetical protein